MESKEYYIAKLETQLREWSTKIDELKVQANLAKADARDEINEQIRDLRKKESALLEKLNALRKAGDEISDEVKASIENSLNDMKNIIKHAVDKLGKLK